MLTDDDYTSFSRKRHRYFEEEINTGCILRADKIKPQEKAVPLLVDGDPHFSGGHPQKVKTSPFRYTPKKWSKQ